MRSFIWFFILLAIDIYAFQALRLVSQNWSWSIRTFAYSLYWISPLLLLALVIISSTSGESDLSNKNFVVYLRAFVFALYASKALIALFLLIDDFRRLFFLVANQFNADSSIRPSRSKFLSQIGLLIGSIPFVSLTYGMARNAYRYKVFKQKVPISNLPENLKGLKIVQISDVHSGSFTFKEPVKNAIEIINQQQADLVFFTGDLVNSVASEMNNFMDVFDKIQAKHGVYSVLGNHDYGDYHHWPNQEAKKANFAELKQKHQQLGWNLLVNEHRILSINNEEVAVIGVENYSTKMHFPRYGDLNKAYQGSNVATLKLLLSHDPSHWEAQVTQEFPDIDITFSGHTHGMQFGIEIPGWIKWSPIKYVYKQWAGLYQHNNQYLYVNRGLGFLGYPGRVGILPEITVLELT